MQKILSFAALLFSVSNASYSQKSAEVKTTESRLSALETKVETLNRLKFSGYIQTQWTWDQAEIPDGKQNNLSVRRGRLKSTYSNKYGEAVLQIDVTEKGVAIKDAYLKIQSPSMKWVALRAGVFGRPAGYEISYSSSERESPERSRVFTTLFPGERDLGAEVILKGHDNTLLEGFTLNAGVFSGNGGKSKETDSHKDFIGHLNYKKVYENISYGLGTSLYAGGVRLAGEETQKAYKLSGRTFMEDASLKAGDYAKRQYYGFDGQFSVESAIGITSLRGEYLWGKQPGNKNSSDSPTGAITTDIYSRNFNGYYVYFIQDVGKSKHTVVVKYDAYDPNTKLSKNECLTDGDVSYSTFGFGWLFRANSNVRVMAFYEIASNEKVNNMSVAPKYNKDIADNLFTLRLQYKF